MTERGSILPALAVVFLSALLVTALAVEVGRWSAARREVAFAADAAAEAGAAMLDEAAVRSGRLILDPMLARDVAEDVAAGPATRTIDVTVDGDLVCVTVGEVFRPRLLASVGVGDTPVSATACARPRAG